MDEWERDTLTRLTSREFNSTRSDDRRPENYYSPGKRGVSSLTGSADWVEIALVTESKNQKYPNSRSPMQGLVTQLNPPTSWDI